MEWVIGAGLALAIVALGLVVVLMGVIFLGKMTFFQRDIKLHSKAPTGLWGAPLLGITFGLGWAPCIGPTLSAVQLLASVSITLKSMASWESPGES
jgi:cytochrome c-type biogenesis protein